jgi:CheY-like chemotaxis protein
VGVIGYNGEYPGRQTDEEPKLLRKILIVDDDPDLREGQRAFLEGRGYEVQTAGSMEEGLEKLEEFAPELILVDLMMKHYDTGFVFSRKVRDNPGLAKVPILMQTSATEKLGFTLDSYDEKARNWMKVDEMLRKPVAPEELLAKIRQYLAE